MKKMAMILFCMAVLPAYAAETVVAGMLDGFRAEGAAEFSAQRGKQMWTQGFTQHTTGKQVSCATCHTSDPKQAGSHIRTSKRIEPMAASVNAERFTEVAKVNKWFLRNCKWTLGRECTAQEKGDFLTYLLSE